MNQTKAFLKRALTVLMMLLMLISTVSVAIVPASAAAPTMSQTYTIDPETGELVPEGGTIIQQSEGGYVTMTPIDDGSDAAPDVVSEEISVEAPVETTEPITEAATQPAKEEKIEFIPKDVVDIVPIGEEEAPEETDVVFPEEAPEAEAPAPVEEEELITGNKDNVADMGANVEVAETGWNQSAVTVYFNASGWTVQTLYVMIGHSTWSSCYAFTKVAGTIYKCSVPAWDGATEWYIVNASAGWGDEGNSPTHRTGWVENASSKRTAALTNNTVYTSSGTTSLTYTVAVGASHATGSTTLKAGVTGGTAKVAGTNSSGTSASSTTTGTGTVSIAALNTTSVTLTASAKTGYTFKGWYTSATGGTQKSTSATYTFTPTANTTLYAQYQQKSFTLTVNAGTGGTASGGGTVYYNTAKSITATPATGYNFSKWTVTSGSATFGSATSASTTCTITAAATIKANFTAKTYTMSYQRNYAFGTVTIGSTSVTHGNTTTYKATANSGCKFINWTVVSGSFTYTSGSSTSASITIKPTSDVKLQANFYIGLTVTAGTGGTASHNDADGYLNYNTNCTVTATPSAGYSFKNWTVSSGSATFGSTTSASTTCKITEATTIKANFTINTYTLTLNKSTGGSVTGAGTYNYNTKVTITATPSTGYSFSGWTVTSGNSPASKTAASTTVTLTQNTTLKANFTINTYTLTLNKSTGGSVTGAGDYDYNTKVTIKATPSTGYSFSGWTVTSGNSPASTSAAETTVTLTKDTTLKANFTINTYKLTLTAGTGGSVSGAGTYNYNTAVTIKATPSTGYIFSGWTVNSGNTPASTSAAETTVTLTKATSLTANFTDDRAYIAGSFNDWTSTLMTLSSGSTYTKSYTLDPGTYTFKFIHRGNWYGNNGGVPDTTDYNGGSNPWETYTDAGDITLNATGGTYKFTYNVSTHKMEVDYTPYTYTVTFKNGDGTTLETQTVAIGKYASPTKTPTKAQTAQYTYTFTGWDKNPATTAITADTTFTPQFSSTVRSYTVTFKNGDGSTLDTKTVQYGSYASTTKTPTKAATAQYTYTFTGWDKDPASTKITGATTFTPQFSSTVNKYTVTFLNGDGKTLETQSVAYGSYASPTKTPTKAQTAQYTYTFTGWDKDPASTKITGATTFTPQFSSTVRKYTVTFLNGDGTTLETQSIAYGSKATPTKTPTKAQTAQYTYTFSGWDKDPASTTITGATTFTPQFTSTVRSYTVTFLNGDGSALDTKTVQYGSYASTTKTPTKAATAQYTYTFSGWDKDPASTKITGATTFTPKFNSTVNKYTVTFLNGDGSALDTKTVEYGSYASTTKTPTKAATAQYTYTFSGWDKDPASTKITGNTTFTPKFTSALRKYTVTFLNYDGSTIATKSVEYGKAATAPTVPARSDGWVFIGWDKEFSNITGDLTVTAQFRDDNVYLMGVTGSWNKGDAGTIMTYGDVSTMTLKLDEGTYTFKFIYNDAWLGNNGAIDNTTDYNGASNPWETYDGNDITLNAIGGTYTFKFDKSNNKFEVKHTPITYTVTFKNWDGSIITTQTVNKGASATAPATPTRPATAQYTYTFKAWDTDFTNVRENLTVTATYSSTVNKYTVTFKDYDGTTLATRTVEYNSAATAPADPTRTGYTFAGWDNDFSKITGNLTVTATYTINKYTVTFKDYDGTTLATRTVEYNKAATAPADPTRTGYTFAGWDNDFSKITGNLTVTATYTINKYTVTFKDWDGKTLATRTVEYNKAATAPSDPSRAADAQYTYTFSGWDKDFSKVTSDLTVTAQYSAIKNKYTVKFVDYDNSTLKTQSVEYGSSASAPSDPTRDDGWVFIGWDKEFSNITGNLTVTAQYRDDNVYLMGITGSWDKVAATTMSYGNISTMTLKLEAGTYEFKFVYNDAWLSNNGEITDTTDVSGASNPWETYDGNNCKLIASGGTYTFKFNKSNSHFEVQFVPDAYTVTFKNWDGTVLAEGEVKRGESASSVAPAKNPTRPATVEYTYTFKGWDKSLDNITGDTVFTAQFTATKNKYTVTFKDWDGSTIASVKVEYGTAANAPADPTRTGYTFTGWDKSFNNVTGNITVTAQYTINTYTVKFVDYDGKTIATRTVEYGKAATAPTAPTRDDGWTFIGWDKEFSNITSNITVTAQYRDDNFYLNGSFFDNWDFKEPMTGDGDNVTFTVELAPGTYEFKLSQGNNWYGNDGTISDTTDYNGVSNPWDLSTTAGNIKLNATGGTYRFTFNTLRNALEVEYEPYMYTVTFKNWDGSILKSYDVAIGTSATAPETPTRPSTAQYDYTFKGWDKDFSNIQGDLTVTAQYDATVRSYNVTFVYIAADGVTEKTVTRTVKYGSAATAPELPRRMDGWVFSAWDKDFSNITGNLTVNALYINDNVYLAGDFNNWNETTLPLELTDDEDVFVITVELKKGTYEFKLKRGDGWYGNTGTITNTTDVNGASNPWFMAATTQYDENNCTLVASGGYYTFTFTKSSQLLDVKYEPYSYTVKFVDYNGNVLKTQTVTAGNDATAPADPTRNDGWVFIGWDKAFTDVSGDLTVTALYRDDNVYLYGSFNNWSEGILMGPAGDNYITAVVRNLTAGNYTFKFKHGDTWYTNEGTVSDTAYQWSTITDGDNCILSASGGTYTFHFNKTTKLFDIEYAPFRYVVTFKDYDGRVIATETVDVGKDATAPAAPTRTDGWVFFGWDKTFTNVQGDITVTAQYYDNNVYVSGGFNNWGETVMGPAGSEIVSTTIELGSGSYEFKFKQNGTWYTNTGTVSDSAFNWDTTTDSSANNIKLNATGGYYKINFNTTTKKFDVEYTPYVYTVTFVDWKGDTLKSEQVEIGKGATAPSVPARDDGWVFLKWDKDFSYITEDTIVTAMYMDNQMYLCCDSTDWHMEYTPMPLENGKYKLTVELPVGQYFFKFTQADTWYTNLGTFTNECYQWDTITDKSLGDCTLNADGGYYTFTFDDVTKKFDVSYVPYYYTVTFKHWDGSVIKEEVVASNKNATAPTSVASKNGYEFLNWDKSFNNITADTVVTAQCYDNNIYLKGDFNEWGTTNVMGTYGDTVVTTRVELAPGTYSFKFFQNGVYYTDKNAGTVYDTTGSEWWGTTTSDSIGNTVINATGGFYTFTFATDTKDFHISYEPYTYTVTFKDYDGKVIGTDTVAIGTAADAPADPTRVGYDFTGWDKDFSKITGDLTVTATYKIKSYTVTFSYLDSDGKTVITKDVTVEHGSAATAPELPRRTDGWAFLKWDKDFSNVTGDMTVTADYVDDNVYLAGDFNNWHEKNLPMDLTDDEDVVTITLELGSGSYQFKLKRGDGWYSNTGEINDTTDYNGNSNPWDMFAGDEYGNCTLNASGGFYTFTYNKSTQKLDVKYEPYTFTVNFVDWDGKTLKTETVIIGNDATAPEIPSREHYDFTGWDKDFANVKSDLTVTATYKIHTFTVTFVYVDRDGETVKYHEVEVEYGKSATAPELPKRTDGWVFLEWDKEFSFITEDTTVTAEYIDDNVYLAGDFNDWNEKTLPMKLTDNDDIVEITITLQQGTYEFKLHKGDGWFTNEGTITDTTDNNGVSNPWDMVAGGEYENCTLNAKGGEYTFIYNKATQQLEVKYSPFKFTVTFVDYNGKVLSTERVEVGTAAKAPTVPARTDGWEFSHWDKDFSNVTEDITVTAQYYDNNIYLKGEFNNWDSSNVLGTYGDIVVSTTIELKPGEYEFKFSQNGAYYTDKNAGTVNDTTGSNWWGTTTSESVGNTTIKATGGYYTFTFATDTKDFHISYVPYTYTVTFVDNNGNVIDKQTVNIGEDATAPSVPTRPDGYVFASWDREFTNVTEDITVTAQYKDDNVYLVGGVTGSWTPDSSTVMNYGDTSSMTVTLQPGEYEFKFVYDGVWYTNTGVVPDTTDVDGNSNPWDTKDDPQNIRLAATGGTYTFTFNKTTKTFEIDYVPFTYTVTFVDFDGTVLKTETVDISKGATAPADPTREHYDFTGWDKDFSKITGDLTVTAQYKVKSYEVTFVYYTADCELTSTVVLVEYGKGVTAPELPRRSDGWVFNAWDVDFSNISGPITVTAQYIDDNVYIAGDFNNWHEKDMPMDLTDDENVVKITIELEEGEYDFKLKRGDGWYSNQGDIPDTTDWNGASNPWDMTAGDDVPNCTINATGGRYTFIYNKETQKLEVKYSPFIYTVTFVDYDGRVIDTQTVNRGEAAIAPDAPTRPADQQYTYTFSKWDTDFSEVRADLTVKAIYDGTLNKYTVTFVDYNGVVLKSEEVEYGSSATAPKTPTRNDGYVFTSWDKDFSNITEATTVTAQYKDMNVYLLGDIFGSWDTSDVTIMKPTEEGSKIVTVTVKLPAGSYEFKLKQGDDWFGNDGDVDDTTLNTSDIGWEMTTSAGDCTLIALGGQYVFNYNTETHMLEILSVTPTYTVTFKDHDGKVIDTQIIREGDSAVAPADPTRAADAQYTYTFAGWDNSFTNITADTVVTATYSTVTNKYTVQFVDHDGTVLNEQVVEYGTAAATPNLTPTRQPDAQYTYTFAGWDVDYSYITGNLTVTAKYSTVTNKYIVTFVDRDGTVLSTQEVEYGSAAIAPADPDPSRLNTAQYTYSFTGWDTDYSYITGTTTVTAQYKATTNQFTVTFKDWNGTILKTQTVNYGGKATAPSNPYRAGYVFDGWDVPYNFITSNTVVTATYVDNNVYLVGDFNNWQLVDQMTGGTTVSVTLELNQGFYAFKVRQGDDYYGKDITIVDKTGGITTSSADGTPNCNLQATGGKYTFTFNKTTKVLTVSYVPYTYTVTFKNWDGSILSTQTVARGNSAVAPGNPTRPGTSQFHYVFSHWDTDFSYIVNDTIVTAVFNEAVNQFTVVFKDYDGRVIDTQTVMYGASAFAPASPERAGYTFAGWSGNYASVTSNTEVYATYNANSYTVTATVSGSGSVTPSTQTVTYPNTVTLVANPSSGYSFKRWVITSGTFEIVGGSSTNRTLTIRPTSDVSIMAVFGQGVNLTVHSYSTNGYDKLYMWESNGTLTNYPNGDYPGTTQPGNTNFNGVTWDTSNKLEMTNGYSSEVGAVLNGGSSIPSGSGKLVIFNNTLGWSDVYLYTSSSNLWNGNNGCTTNGATRYNMQRIGSTNYWYAYVTNTSSILFMKDIQDGYGNIWQTSACFRTDYNSAYPTFTPNTTSNQTTNSTTYYSNGTWSGTPSIGAQSGNIYLQDTLYQGGAWAGVDEVWIYQSGSTSIVTTRRDLLDFIELMEDTYNNGVNSEGYTNETWSDFVDAFENAYDISGKSTSTQTQIDAAQKALKEAYDALKKVKYYTIFVSQTNGTGVVVVGDTTIKTVTGSASAVENTAVNVSVTAPADYFIKQIIVNGEVVFESKGTSTTTYTIASILSNTDIEVVYDSKPVYTIKVEPYDSTAGKLYYNGEVIPATGKTIAVDAGDSVTITAVSSAGYTIKSWTVDGKSAGRDGSYTFSSVTDNHTIAIDWQKIENIKVTVNANPGAAGNATATDGVYTAASNGTNNYTGKQFEVITLEANTTDRCYEFTGWTIKGEYDTYDSSTIANSTFKIVGMSDLTITANYELVYRKIYLQNDAGWSQPWLYFWGSNTHTSNWPGEKMTYDSNTGYWVGYIPIDTTDIQFNDGTNQHQVEFSDVTPNLYNNGTGSTGTFVEDGIYLQGSWDGVHHSAYDLIKFHENGDGTYSVTVNVNSTIDGYMYVNPTDENSNFWQAIFNGNTDNPQILNALSGYTPNPNFVKVEIDTNDFNADAEVTFTFNPTTLEFSWTVVKSVPTIDIIGTDGMTTNSADKTAGMITPNNRVGDTYFDRNTVNSVSVRDTYETADITAGTTVTFSTQVNMNAAGNYDYYVAGWVINGTEFVAASNAGNGLYTGSYTFTEDGSTVVPVYFHTDAWLKANGVETVKVYAVADKSITNWNKYFSAYTWYNDGKTTNYEQFGYYPGQLMIPIAGSDGLYYTIVETKSPDGTDISGILFNNYAPNLNGEANENDTIVVDYSNLQTYDFYEFIALLEDGMENITFVIKNTNDEYNSNRVSADTNVNLNDFNFDRFVDYSGLKTDIFGNNIEGIDVTLSDSNALYIIQAGNKEVYNDILNGSYYVECYLYDATGKYLGKCYSYELHDKESDIWSTLLADYEYERVYISYESVNGSRYDGEWYGDASVSTEINVSVNVGLTNNSGKDYTVDADTENDGVNIAIYGEAYIDINKQNVNVVRGTTVSITATPATGYKFIGWFTKEGELFSKNTTVMVDVAIGTTFTAVFEKLESGNFYVNHYIYTGVGDSAYVPRPNGGSAQLFVGIDNVTQGTSTGLAQRETASIAAKEGDELIITIATDANGADKFYAWYVAAKDKYGLSTFEEVGVDSVDNLYNNNGTVIGRNDMVYFQFKYTVKDNDSYSMTLFSDLIAVAADITLQYQYTDRNGKTKNYYVNYTLTDEEIEGFAGNNFTPYTPAYITGDGWINTVLANAPYVDDLYKNTTWIITEAMYDTLNFVLWATQPQAEYNVTVMVGDDVSIHKVPFNTVIQLNALELSTEAQTSGFWYNDADGDGIYTEGVDNILTYGPMFTNRITADMNLYYENSTDLDFNVTIEAPLYGREQTTDDKGNNKTDKVTVDYIVNILTPYFYDGTNFTPIYNGEVVTENWKGQHVTIESLEAAGFTVDYGVIVEQVGSFEPGSDKYPTFEDALAAAKDKNYGTATDSAILTDVVMNYTGPVMTSAGTYCTVFDATSHVITNKNRFQFTLDYNNTIANQKKFFNVYSYVTVTTPEGVTTTYISNVQTLNIYTIGTSVVVDNNTTV